MNKIRPSPTQSATLYKTNTKKKGNDGNIWIVVENINGIKRWHLYKKPTKKLSKMQNNNFYEKQMSTYKYFYIVFCEPLMHFNYISDKKQIMNFLHIYIKINKKLYKKLLKSPKNYNKNNTNAYVFGKLYPIEKYKYVGYMTNDIAQTGFVDATGMTINENNEITEAIGKKIYDGDWNDIDILRDIQKNITPRILFIGETVGGDVGASLYVHQNDDGEFDSIIIDNLYFFKPKT